MKPILIYTCARCRSSAALSSAKRDVKISEPFSNWEMVFRPALENRPRIEQTHEWWSDLVEQMKNPNSATKIMGVHMMTCLYSRDWFTNIIENDTHDVFILVRDLREACQSFLVGCLYGFSKHGELEPKDTQISWWHAQQMLIQVDQFLRFLPSKGKVVTFDTLPDSHFDRSLCTTVNQHSLLKYESIENLDFTERAIEQVISYYGNDWNNLMKQAEA